MLSSSTIGMQSLIIEDKALTNSHTQTKLHKVNWIINPQPKPEACLRLFCLPYAAGSTSVFRNWSDSLPENVEVYAIKLSHNLNSKNHMPFEYIGSLVEDLAQFILPYINKEFAFYGHSLGALINFELSRYLRQEYNLKPIHFFVGAQHAPHLPYPYPAINELTQSKLIEFIKDLTNTELPESIQKNKRFLESLLLSLQVSSTIQNENYNYTVKEPFDFPITVFGGLQDKFLTQQHLMAWQIHTNNLFKLKMFSGKHLFITSHKEQLLQEICQEFQ